MSEYRALRASIMRRWTEQGHVGDDRDVTRFHEAIDESLAEAAISYSAMLERTREQFVGVLGHDLRNPLNAIVVGATLLTNTDCLEDRESRVAMRILSAANRMTRMVSDLLDLTRTQLGTGIPVSLRQMDLAPLCVQVISELEILRPGPGVRFESHGVLLGEWDADRLHQAISNLVSNALEHGWRETGVTVIAQEQGEDVVLRVHNDGTPIPAGVLARIFEPMVQEPSSRAERHADGLGLGLFIARAVAAAHGGTLSVTSTEADGTTFTMQLPRRPATTPPLSREASPEPQVSRAVAPVPHSAGGVTPPTRVRKAPPRPHKGETPGRSA